MLQLPGSALCESDRLLYACHACCLQLCCLLNCLQLLPLRYLQAGHALVGSLMPEYDPVTKISIVPRGNAGGLTFFAPSEERLESGLYSRSYLENQMAVAMGGRVAEELIFGPDDVTTGASGDFQQVCLSDIFMVGVWTKCLPLFVGYRSLSQLRGCCCTCCCGQVLCGLVVLLMEASQLVSILCQHDLPDGAPALDRIICTFRLCTGFMLQQACCIGWSVMICWRICRCQMFG